MSEREEIREAQVHAATVKTKAERALERHRQLMAALLAAEKAIQRARRAAAL